MAKNKPQPSTDDPTEERRDGPTPNGGVALLAYYFDENWVSVPKSRATRVEIAEVDDKGDIVFRTHGTIGRKA